MWEIVAVTLCLGLPADAELSNCSTFNDSWGPYATREECDARTAEIAVTWPMTIAAATGYMGPVIVIGNECTLSGEDV
ncbi:hypothetical protein FDH38_gp046 [Dinoroseobacter phage vB_DshS-R5C]|uniref:Uncharacterized protein n=1 Tax=Dinoroseobacter phage vB_DshS-R5C TaxID=1965368 RepID=A0A1V0DY92_9CAUD|nr:hypothetical protein FDH38_gp046 [Dinoroseobacter phage vB_DshS-R5C]ARB06100.1 hypothetical protein vBDshSR5C_46 [Dinoroseobacter phage vB_DshS-R5C]